MKKEMNNKGFSLVELIIVIAIMAVLVVILAPQYLKYVERSRNSTDIQNATEIVTAIQTYAADPEATVAPADFVLKIEDTAVTPAAGFVTEALKNAGLLDSTGKLSTTCKSKTKWTEYEITGTVEADGNITFTYANADFANAMIGKTGS